MRNDPLGFLSESEPDFGRSFLKVLAAHLVLIVVVWVAGKFFFKQPMTEPIVWLDGGGVLGAAASGEQSAALSDSKPVELPEPPAPEVPVRSKEPSDLPIEVIPAPTKTPTPTPRPRATPSPTPLPKQATPVRKTSAVTTPVPKKKPTPRAVTAKIATPRPGARSVTPKITNATNAASDAAGSNSEKSAARTGPGDATNAGRKGGPGAPGGTDSLLLGYFKKVEAQFHEEWQQPLTVVRSGHDVEAHVRLRAAADGTVESLTLVKPTGNHEVDQSIENALRRVRKVERPPAGLLKNGALDELVAFILEL